MIKLENASKTYQATSIETLALRNISLEVERGEFEVGVEQGGWQLTAHGDMDASPDARVHRIDVELGDVPSPDLE